MQTRFLIAALAGCALLVLGAFWQIAQPDERPRTRVPGSVSLDDLDDIDEAPLPAEPELEPDEPAPLEAPPPPPLLANDPGKGTIWLRVIDAATNRPLANTNCRMIPSGVFWGAYTYNSDLPPKGVRKTDHAGLLSFTSVIADADQTGREDEFDGYDVIIRSDPYETYRYLTPVPAGWYAEGEIDDVNYAIYELSEQPTQRPVDIYVRRMASVRISARDRYGVPIPDAQLRPNLIIGDSGAEDWLDAFGDQDIVYHQTESWREEANELRREIRADQVSCTLLGARVEQDEPDVPWYVEEAAAANQFGSVSYRNLPCVGVGVLAWHPRYGTATARMDLQSGSNELNVYFREDLACELRVKVDWMPIPDERPEIELQIQRTGPQGKSEFITDSRDWFYRDWYFITSGGTSELVISGLPPGWWHVRVDDGEWYSGANLELAPGETRTVQMHLGEKAQAYWTPVVKSGGVQLEEAALHLLGGSDGYREQYEIYHDREDNITECIELAPGTYTAWLPTLEPFTFTLKPGEERVDTFELRSLNVNITLGADLAKFLGNPDEGARLDLLPIDMWEDAREHLYSLDASMRKLDKDYDLLKPGIVRGWMLPPGEYEWQLYGTNEEVHGRVTFTDTGPTSLHFGLDTLPGYACLDVTLIGFAPTPKPDLWLDEESNDYLALRPGRKRGEFDVPDDDSFRDQLEREIQVTVVRASDTRWVFFAPPGTMRLSVWQDESERDFLVTVPSRMTINAHELGKHGFREMMILSEPEDPEAPSVYPEDLYDEEYRIELSAPGWFEVTGPYDVCDVPHGSFTVKVTREREFYSDVRTWEYAELTFEKGTDDLVLELWKLNYRSGANLDLVFKGRGSPVKTEDAWWFKAKGPEAPRLYQLDASGNVARLVMIRGMTDYMPNGRLEFAVRGVKLPPGNYRLVPWEDAPAKHIREFSLQSGQHTTITIEVE